MTATHSAIAAGKRGVMASIVDWLIDMPSAARRFSVAAATVRTHRCRLGVHVVRLDEAEQPLSDRRFPGMISRFAEWGIPYPSIMAPFVSGVEFFGGILLLLGLFTRIAATPLVIVMIVAIVSAKWDQVDSLETLLGFEEVAYMALFGWLAVQGPGRSRSTTCCSGGMGAMRLSSTGSRIDDG